MIKLARDLADISPKTRASRTGREGVVVLAASEFGDLTLSGTAWERAEVSIRIRRFGSLL